MVAPHPPPHTTAHTTGPHLDSRQGGGGGGERERKAVETEGRWEGLRREKEKGRRGGR